MSMLLVILLAMQIELMGRPHGRSSRKPERCNDFCRWVVLVFIAPREGLVIGGWMRAFAFNESFLLRGFYELAEPTLLSLTPTSQPCTTTMDNPAMFCQCFAQCNLCTFPTVPTVNCTLTPILVLGTLLRRGMYRVFTFPHDFLSVVKDEQPNITLHCERTRTMSLRF